MQKPPAPPARPGGIGLRHTGSFGSHLWKPETVELLRRLGNAPHTLLENAAGLEKIEKAPQPVLTRCLDYLRTHYMASRGLAGKVTFDTNLPALEAPEGPLRSMLEHLVDGGLRANPSKGPYCHVAKGAEDEASVTLMIRDNGVAIPECTLDQIRRFIQETKVEQVPDRIYRLFLADNLVRWVGGTMWVGATANGTGTTVFVKLPKTSNAKGPENPLLAQHVF
ncbi:MAG TPA: ATP-binding protein [Candidatus Thermoplasmatota archaeon]|nr:ATP-binding protein [Candidatus Thermoplasmatota archaeon]